MAHASRQVRKIRRIKRERTLAIKMGDIALQQRDQARMIAYALEQELSKYVSKDEASTVREVASEPALTITRIDDDEPEVTVGE